MEFPAGFVELCQAKEVSTENLSLLEDTRMNSFEVLSNNEMWIFLVQYILIIKYKVHFFIASFAILTIISNFVENIVT